MSAAPIHLDLSDLRLSRNLPPEQEGGWVDIDLETVASGLVWAESALAVTASYTGPDQARQQRALETVRAAIRVLRGES